MTAKQFADVRRVLEHRFRRHGIEGEEAFYAVCYGYVITRSLTVPRESRIHTRGSAAFSNLPMDLAMLVEQIASKDGSGFELPNLYQHFLGRRFREGSGKFFTPSSVADSMVALIQKRQGLKIMDPTCGGGTFLLKSSHALVDFDCDLIGADIEPSLVELSRLSLALGSTDRHSKSVFETNIYDTDNRLHELSDSIDYIIANPPFSLPIQSVSFKSRLFNLGYKKSDALFLDVSLQLLKTGGRLICLLPHGLIANAEYSRFRKEVEMDWSLLGVIGLTEGIFYMTANTSTRADIVVLEKGQSRRRSFFAFSPTAGVALNSRTFDITQNQLNLIVNDREIQSIVQEV